MGCPGARQEDTSSSSTAAGKEMKTCFCNSHGRSQRECSPFPFPSAGYRGLEGSLSIRNLKGSLGSSTRHHTCGRMARLRGRRPDRGGRCRGAAAVKGAGSEWAVSCLLSSFPSRSVLCQSQRLSSPQPHRLRGALNRAPHFSLMTPGVSSCVGCDM